MLYAVSMGQIIIIIIQSAKKFQNIETSTEDFKSYMSPYFEYSVPSWSRHLLKHNAGFKKSTKINYRVIF